jgi:hypothetical protein
MTRPDKVPPGTNFPPGSLLIVYVIASIIIVIATFIGWCLS